MGSNRESECISDLIVAARAGDVAAYGRLVRATQAMAPAVALNVLRDPAAAEDAVQEAYLRAYRTLRDLEDPPAFPGWLRRIVITVALNLRRVRRVTLLSLDDVPGMPVLDESETRWSDSQRQRLAAALLALDAEERRICDRRYYGGWSLGRLAEAAGTTETTMRKRLQRMLDDCEKLDPWQLTGRVLQSVDRTLQGRPVKIMPVQYPMCTRA